MARCKSWLWLGFALLGASSGCLVLGPNEPSSGLGAAPRCDQQSEPRPLVAEWAEADRRELEQRVRQGKLVLVRYAGCQLTPLYDCSAPGGYRYHGFSRKSETLRVSSSEEMRTLLPRSSTEMQQAKSLDVRMELVGSYSTDDAPATAQLTGQCAGATHAITEVMVGAFRLASAQSSREQRSDQPERATDEHALRSGGDPDACAQGPRRDDAPPERCDAAVRIGLRALR